MLTNCIIGATRELDRLAATHAAWLADYDDASLDVGCDCDVLTSLVATAPSDFARGLLTGRLLLLNQIANETVCR